MNEYKILKYKEYMHLPRTLSRATREGRQRRREGYPAP